MALLDAARCSCLTCSVSCHGALNRGSSKHGKARRASVGSNCVYTYQGGFCPSRNWNTPALLELRIFPEYATCRVPEPGARGGSKAKPTKPAPPDVTPAARVSPPARRVADSIVSSEALSQSTGVLSVTLNSISAAPRKALSPGTTVRSTA